MPKPKLFQGSLFLYVYLIGYREQGESVVLFVKDSEDTIYYSGVIDSFEYNNTNKTIELLESHGIQYLDFLGWTHTDEDHSLGIDQILNKPYINLNTQIVLPQGVHATRDYCRECVIEVLDELDELITPRPGKKKYNVKFASDYQVWRKDFYRNIETQFLFKLTSISPNSTIVRSRDLGKSFTKNDYSVAFVLEIGGISLIFSGDIENYTIANFEDHYLPEKVEYLKVPHHSSSGSIKLLQYFDPERPIEIACTTVFRANKLPDPLVIKQYEDYSQELYCTGKKEVSEEENDWGVVKVKFDIIEKTYGVSLSGNASKWF